MRCDVFAAGRILRDIIPGDSMGHFIAECSHDDPVRRPATGAEMLASWQKLAAHVTAPDWQRLVRPLLSEQLSARLAASARVLLHAGRHDEAYWLLVESIEENARNAEAVTLMNSFPKHVRRKRIQTRAAYACAAGICLGLLLIAFFAGRQSREWAFAPPLSVEKQREIKDRNAILAAAVRVPSPLFGTVPFRRDTASSGRLSGTLYLAARPASGRLSIDGEPVERITGYKTGITLAFGKHTLAWLDENGQIFWREKITMLPFETKIVSVAPSTHN
jgi:hypothetical protein